MIQDNVRTFTGRSLQELSIEKVLSGELSAEDFRISAATLRQQASLTGLKYPLMLKKRRTSPFRQVGVQPAVNAGSIP